MDIMSVDEKVKAFKSNIKAIYQLKDFLGYCVNELKKENIEDINILNVTLMFEILTGINVLYKLEITHPIYYNNIKDLHLEILKRIESVTSSEELLVIETKQKINDAKKYLENIKVYRKELENFFTEQFALYNAKVEKIMRSIAEHNEITQKADMLSVLVSDDEIFVKSFCYPCNDYILRAVLLYKINEIKKEKYTENRFSLSAESSTKQKVFPEEEIDTTLLKILVAIFKQEIQIAEIREITEIKTDDFIIEILNINYLNLEKELEIIEFNRSYTDEPKMIVYNKLEPVLGRIDNLYKEILLKNNEKNLPVLKINDSDFDCLETINSQEKFLSENIIEHASTSPLSIKRKREHDIEEGESSKRMRI